MRVDAFVDAVVSPKDSWKLSVIGRHRAVWKEAVRWSASCLFSEMVQVWDQTHSEERWTVVVVTVTVRIYLTYYGTSKCWEVHNDMDKAVGKKQNLRNEVKKVINE
jgi:hypothetical protein